MNTQSLVVKFPSADTARIGADTLRAESHVAQKWVKFTDMLIADGITSAMLASKDGSQELREFVKTNIVLPSFRSEELALMAKETKSLPEEKKAQKRFLQQQIGSRLGKIERHLKDAEAQSNEADGTPKASKTDAQRIQKMLDDLLTKVRKIENPSFDTVTVCALLRDCKKIVPAV